MNTGTETELNPFIYFFTDLLLCRLVWPDLKHHPSPLQPGGFSIYKSQILINFMEIHNDVQRSPLSKILALD